ncbi:hypothetical protein PHMEG_0009957 [Phytophthora megakarya]|uniref:DDE Tnp4 domain-containing protein n=1 Tax=Phytophthora megakarya TaxID=4795 RepID=A0A225WFG6_9STRA|nr:hypothetical protein PHMEG_0009957 [Phytophthora megakarya]
MNEQVETGNTFSNYPHALYATDVTFAPAYRPTGRFTEQKKYFSVKHKFYGFKIECSVTPPRFSVDVPGRAPNSMSELTMMLDLDNGAERVLRTIQLREQQRKCTLDRQDIARNKVISADRVLVEHFFNRMCFMWKATYATLKLNENRFGSVDPLCAALTNYHVGLMPLRARDNGLYDMILFKYQTMGERIRTQQARTQLYYRMREQVRLRPAPYNTRVPVSQRETQFISQESFAF